MRYRVTRKHRPGKHISPKHILNTFLYQSSPLDRLTFKIQRWCPPPLLSWAAKVIKNPSLMQTHCAVTMLSLFHDLMHTWGRVNQHIHSQGQNYSGTFRNKQLQQRGHGWQTAITNTSSRLGKNASGCLEAMWVHSSTFSDRAFQVSKLSFTLEDAVLWFKLTSLHIQQVFEDVFAW